MEVSKGVAERAVVRGWEAAVMVGVMEGQRVAAGLVAVMAAAVGAEMAVEVSAV